MQPKVKHLQKSHDQFDEFIIDFICGGVFPVQVSMPYQIRT